MDIDGVNEVGAKLASFTSTSDNMSIVIDMSGVDYIGSLGLGTFVSVSRSVGHRGGKMVLYGLQEPVTKVFETSGMNRLIPLVANLDAACRSVKPQGK